MPISSSAYEERVASDLDFKRGILDSESNDPRVKFMAKIQEGWREQAKTDQVKVSKNPTDLNKDLDSVSKEEDRRLKNKEFDYPERLMAATAVEYLFAKSKVEQDRDLHVFALSRYDQLKEKADMVLSLPNDQGKKIGLAISVGNALSNETAKYKAKEYIDAIRAGKIQTGRQAVKGEMDIDAQCKYLADESLRDQVMPRIEIFLANGMVEKLVDAMMSSRIKDDLSLKEQTEKFKIKSEIELQLLALAGALEDYLQKGAESGNREQAKDILKKVKDFREIFKK